MVEKATLVVIANNQEDPNTKIEAQFNPPSIRISYRARGQSGTTSSPAEGKPGSQGAQTNQLTDLSITLSSLELIFDTTQTNEDVRSKFTLIIAEKMMKSKDTPTAPQVRFQWGSFMFKGTINSMDETLDYFSDKGIPLRATVNLSVSFNDERPKDPQGGNAGAGAGGASKLGLNASVSAGVSASAGISASASFSGSAAVGTSELTLAASGEALQSISGRAGVDWKAVASANNIDNPRKLEAGAVLNLNAKAEIR